MSTETVTFAAYNAPSAIVSRSIKALTVPDVPPIVFVVDDDISVRESLELLIKSAGMRPETFVSAQDFLSHPQPAVPCCLVLDVSLPGLNGLELQQRLGERSDIPIIFITGYGDVPMSVRAMKAGAVAPHSASMRRCERCGPATSRSRRVSGRSSSSSFQVC